MEVRSITDKAYKSLQNKFRGLVSDFKARGFIKERTASPSRQFRSGLRALLLDAREELHPSQFSTFLAWIKNQIKAQLADLAGMPTGYDELSGVFSQASVVSLEREILWITARIKCESRKLNAFRVAAHGIEDLVFLGAFEEAITGLDAVEKALGASFWGIQLRIALEQQAGGLERQKRYVAGARAVYKQGLLNFVTYHTSVLNEEKTTLAKFLDDIKGRIEKHRYFQPDVKTYVSYRLTGKWPKSELELAEVLKVEQSHSLIDVYETFIAFAQEVAQLDTSSELKIVVSKSLHSLEEVHDFRIQKALLVIDGSSNCATLEPRSTKISDQLFTGNVRVAAKWAAEITASPARTDPWQYIYAGLTYSHASRNRETVLRQPGEMGKLLGRVLRQSEFPGESFGQLNKLATNLRGIPTAVGLLEMLRQLRRVRPEEEWRPLLIGLNSSSIGSEDLIPNGFKDEGSEMTSISVCPTSTAWSEFRRPSRESTDRNLGIAILSAAGLLREREYLAASQILSTHAPEVSFGNLDVVTGLLLLHAFFGMQDRQNVIDLIAKSGTRGEAHRQLLPILPTLENYVWADYKIGINPLAAPVALHLLWTQNENEITLSLLRFATAQFLKNANSLRPSQLFDCANKFPTHQLIYFLREVCVPQILDVTRVLKSSRDVMEERQAIYAVLRILDPKNNEFYEAEVMGISNQLALDEGQWIVDRTRIHVETDALSRWAVRELSEDYERYSDLLTVDVGTEQNFDDVLKELETTAISPRTALAPNSEADAVLISLLRRVGEEFLNNPSFGLDFYLSQRIRHQSFIGLIRGPLEFSNLITTRESEGGAYHRNEIWLEKFESSTVEVKESINDALVKCAAIFDDTLIAAKDRSFQIRSQEKPGGLLFLELTNELIDFARAVVRMDESLADFVVTVTGVLWGALEASLAVTRSFISEELKSKIADGFDELRATVRKTAEQDPAFLEFDMEVGRCSSEVQRALDDAANWFTRTDLEVHKRLFTLTQVVKIAIDAALKSQRAFVPEIIHEVTGELSMTATSLVFVHDVIFVALDNVRAHSGIKSPKVDIRVHPDIEEGTLTIKVLSQCLLEGRASKEKELRDIRQLIEKKTVTRRTRREGRSGFLKLAAVVGQSKKGNIEFGFLEGNESLDRQFHLTVTFSLLIHQAALKET